MVNHSSGNRIIISGLTAAGKTTHARLLEKKFGLKYVSASNTLLELMGMSSEDVSADFWASSKAKKLVGLRDEDRSFDKLVDQKISEIIEKNENIVVDSWAAAWLTGENTLRIWLDSSINSRIWKAMVSHGLSSDRSYEEYQSLLVDKDEGTRKIFLEEYGFDLFHDHELFDLIVDITELIAEPSFAASQVSIDSVDELIAPIIGVYLERGNEYLDKFKEVEATVSPTLFKKVPRWLL